MAWTGIAAVITALVAAITPLWSILGERSRLRTLERLNGIAAGMADSPPGKPVKKGQSAPPSTEVQQVRKLQSALLAAMQAKLDRPGWVRRTWVAYIVAVVGGIGGFAVYVLAYAMNQAKEIDTVGVTVASLVTAVLVVAALFAYVFGAVISVIGVVKDHKTKTD